MFASKGVSYMAPFHNWAEAPLFHGATLVRGDTPNALIFQILTEDWL